jgi:hypothetical protein
LLWENRFLKILTLLWGFYLRHWASDDDFITCYQHRILALRSIPELGTHWRKRGQYFIKKKFSYENPVYQTIYELVPLYRSVMMNAAAPKGTPPRRISD